MANMQVLVASSFPESHNRNQMMAENLAEGFREVLSSEFVAARSFANAEDAVNILKPKLVVLVGSPAATESNFRLFATVCRKVGALFAFWTVEDPYEFDFNFRFSRYADLVFSNDANAVDFYDRDRVYHLPTASTAKLVREIGPFGERARDVFFCGVGFPNRQILVKNLLPTLRRHRSLILGDGWPQLDRSIVINKRISHHALCDYYSSSICVLNVYRTLMIANNTRALQSVTPGPRTFEAAMAGCVQFYHQPSRYLSDYFEPNKEIVVFDSVEEFGWKLQQLLDDMPAARAIAQAAQDRAVKDHTYKARAERILKYSGFA
jgi:spore maturation protein CgeB